jgi:LacI family transcriptional regulator
VPEGTRVDNVRADSRTGVRLAIDHQYALGRRRIAMVNGPLDTVPGAARGAAYREALQDLGLPYDENLVQIGDFYRAEGGRAVAELLARVPDVDALMCANDLIALGALDVLRAAGRRVPEDVAVVGMDDTDLAAASWPSLTSVSLGSAERGKAAAELLLERLQGGDREPRLVTVPPELVIRASTAGEPSGPGGPGERSGQGGGTGPSGPGAGYQHRTDEGGKA